MLESDARKKRCPRKFMNHPVASAGAVTLQGNVYCDGLDCMGWEEWKNFSSSPPIPCDPPEGNCGMKPPTEE